MLKVWGRLNSVNVQKVMWAVDELGLAHERVNAGLHYGIVNEPWYRAMNPHGRVPTIQDGEFVLWESNAIVRYLAANYSSGTVRLQPDAMSTRASADSWMDWAITTLAPVMTPLFWGLIRTPPDRRDAVAIAQHSEAMEALVQLLDDALAGKRFVTGDQLNMGDIPLGCFIHRWYALPIRRGGHPRVAAWYARLADRPAFRRQVMLPLS